MRRRGALAGVLLLAVLGAVGFSACSDEKGSSGGGGASSTAPASGATGSAPRSVTSAGAEACGRVTDPLITAAIGSPYSDVGVKVLTNFPSTGVTGFECQWRYRDDAGAERMLRVDMLDFDRTPEGTLDESWQGALKTAGALASKVENIGDEAIGVSIPGVASVSARGGTWQVTALSTSDGSIPAAELGALALVVQAALGAAG